ncbi:hypothetical protein [Flammeovirga kamogawensis]|uniref:Uncharacterized protein n=1 Tax=Flammeovirga kamogawensis TaxID=373891 RepID=A0ABX8GS05_9BACT|nr:hypothetical protein [Flammeovirga kamogawensis]MBB6463694.1 hypothetical protein [Flammeovirga kamogawensis]QWG06194.1 hypothetical protein KM029_12675 [Flammeovirga kamogawensis]TRX68025.1 hypothetical protein EO216_07695 [Flammeovirga kamogawensis]
MLDATKFLQIDTIKKNKQTIEAQFKVNQNILSETETDAPEASMMELVKKIYENKENVHCSISSANKIKLISLFKPEEQSVVDMSINTKNYSEKDIGVSAEISTDDKVFFKFEGIFTLSDN